MYEYKYVTIKLSKEQEVAVQMQLADIESVNNLIQDLVNQESKDGWEPFYPFSFPSLWFKRQIKRKKGV